jgi:hypothetical protein
MAAEFPATPAYDSRTAFGLPVDPEVVSSTAVSGKMSPGGRCARRRHTPQSAGT